MGRRLGTLAALLIGGIVTLGGEYLVNHHNPNKALSVDPVSKSIDPIQSKPIVPLPESVKVTKSNQDSNYPAILPSDPNNSVQSAPIVDYGSTMSALDGVTKDGSVFLKAIRRLSKEPNMQNAHDADLAGVTYFLSLYGATKDEPKFYRQIMYATHFLGDAERCIKSYGLIENNKEISELTQRMTRRIKIGRKFALEGKNKDLEKQIEDIASKY